MYMGLSIDQARAAKNKAEAGNVFTDPNVVGVGITKIADDYAIKVNLRKPAGADCHYPDSIDGVPIRFEVVGDIKKQPL